MRLYGEALRLRPGDKTAMIGMAETMALDAVSREYPPHDPKVVGLQRVYRRMVAAHPGRWFELSVAAVDLPSMQFDGAQCGRKTMRTA